MMFKLKKFFVFVNLHMNNNTNDNNNNVKHQDPFQLKIEFFLLFQNFFYFYWKYIQKGDKKRRRNKNTKNDTIKYI